MTLLADSIKDSGVHQPGICRKRKEGGYEIIEGHRRHSIKTFEDAEKIAFEVFEACG